ncbi:hypothetical protein DQ04_06141060, partial [Trypanosoma grayi]|uniref:hypothetical protein n=1 Tax=Trypanosoma grayi TaxID=71804 RepID=UPI0004F452D4
VLAEPHSQGENECVNVRSSRPAKTSAACCHDAPDGAHGAAPLPTPHTRRATGEKGAKAQCTHRRVQRTPTGRVRCWAFAACCVHRSRLKHTHTHMAGSSRHRQQSGKQR